MNLNEAYQLWKSNPTDETYNILGKKLMWYVPRQLRTLKYYSNNVTISDEMYEDIVGNTYVKVFQYLDRYDPEKSLFTTWVHTKMLDCMKDEIAKVEERNEYPLYENTAQHNPFDGIDAKLDLKMLISKLNEEDQQFVKFKLQKYTNKEIADFYGKDPKWVDNTDQRIKKIFRTFL